MSFKCWNWLY